MTDLSDTLDDLLNESSSGDHVDLGVDLDIDALLNESGGDDDPHLDLDSPSPRQPAAAATHTPSPQA